MFDYEYHELNDAKKDIVIQKMIDIHIPFSNHKQIYHEFSTEFLLSYYPYCKSFPFTIILFSTAMDSDTDEMSMKEFKRMSRMIISDSVTSEEKVDVQIPDILCVKKLESVKVVQYIVWSEVKEFVEQEWIDRLYMNRAMKERFEQDFEDCQQIYRNYTHKILIEEFNIQPAKFCCTFVQFLCIFIVFQIFHQFFQSFVNRKSKKEKFTNYSNFSHSQI